MDSCNLGIRVYGLSIGLQLSSSTFQSLVLDRLPPGWEMGPSEGADRVYTVSLAEDSGTGQHQLLVDGALLYFHDRLDDLLRWLERDLQIYVAEKCQGLLFVHAGVVGWRGQAMILPGRGLTGRDTLIYSLIRAGAEYYSDRYAVFDSNGHVHPYAVPLDEPLSVAAATPLPAGLIVATYYTPRGTWKPRRISPGCALLLLFANVVSARPNSGLTLATLRKVVSNTVGLESARGEAAETSELLLSELGESPQMASSSSSSSCF